MNKKQESPYYQEDGKSQTLIYESVEKVDNYYVGTAYLQNTGGSGQFQVQVSGQRADIEKYAEEARFHEISLVPAREPETPKETTRNRWQRLLNDQCKAMQNLLEQLDDETLAREEKVYEILRTKGLDNVASLLRPDSAIDFSLAREIKIIPPKLDEPGFYELKFQIHPSVAAGHADYYDPSFNLGDSATVNLQTIGGDPDLYLYRGGWLQAMSLRWAGYDEFVSANGGAGSWRVKVYGYSAAQYEISSTWIYQFTI
ncbi:MAG: hypothetical protein H6636_12445 [Anaerolineales bacterium]|nr:hypothetical protein [Anaerolineales bacterium]